jgi:hypothetical protein
MGTASKDPVQKRIELIAYTLWAGSTLTGLAVAGYDFALGVFLGGIVCLGNYHFLWRHTVSSVTFPARQGRPTVRRNILAVLHRGGLYVHSPAPCDVLGLLLGLSVIMLGVMSYACYTYICAGGH